MIETPYDIAVNIFSDRTLNNATLYVPVGTIDRYKAAEGWKEFKNIVGAEDPSGIVAVHSGGIDNKKVFDLRGQRVACPSKGIFITNGRKIVIP